MNISPADSSMPLKVTKQDYGDKESKSVFRQFVGETVFSQMLSSMRKTQGETPYFNGGRAEKVFQGQLDQEIVKHVAESSADRFADPMYDLFMLQRR